MSGVKWDKNGIQLADVPGTGVSRPSATQRSGNKLHDTRSGKFGQGGGGPQPRATATAPAQNDPVEYSRMIDAARDAARSLSGFDEGTITDFIKSRANSPDQVDIASFIQIVEEQRKADLVDLLDQALRTGKRKVRLTAARGYVKELMAQAKSDTIAEIMTRLEAMGHDRAKVDAFFEGKVSTHEEAVKKRDAVAAAASSGWTGDFFGTLSESPFDGDEGHASHDEIVAQFAQMMERMPQPNITVEPHIEIRMPSGKKLVHRDARGFIESVEDAGSED